MYNSRQSPLSAVFMRQNDAWRFRSLILEIENCNESGNQNRNVILLQLAYGVTDPVNQKNYNRTSWGKNVSPDIVRKQPHHNKSQPDIVRKQSKQDKSQPDIVKKQSKQDKLQPDIARKQPQQEKSRPENCKQINRNKTKHAQIECNATKSNQTNCRLTNCSQTMGSCQTSQNSVLQPRCFYGKMRIRAG